MKIIVGFILILISSEYLNGDYNFEKLESGGMLTLGFEKVWSLWKRKFSKIYLTTEEDTYRRAVWENNLRIIQAHNVLYDLDQVTYSMGLNEFSDLTFKEFSKMYLIKNLDHQFKNALDNVTYYESPSNSEELPSSVDWRKHGYVTNVKNQGSCGSCWAFSTTGSLEGQYYRKTKKLISFSEQQLVDCDTHDKGCKGGFMTSAFHYIHLNGITSEDRYPYTGTASQICRYKTSMAVTSLSSSKHVDPSEKGLASALSELGPISIAILVNSNFMHYRSGIYTDENCNGSANHAVLAVGYSSEFSNYWIVKNSWGPQWGEAGYIRMAKSNDNLCGIYNHAYIPVI